MVLSLLLAWGRFAPMFYGTLYQLPYFSTIRNPAKFTIFMCWAIVVLFAYGVHALSRRYMDSRGPKPLGLVPQIQAWWAKAGKFDRNWFYGSLAALALSITAGVVLQHKIPQLVDYLSIIGFTPVMTPAQDNSGAAIAAFCLHQYTWFIGWLAVALLLIVLVTSGYFSGSRSEGRHDSSHRLFPV